MAEGLPEDLFRGHLADLRSVEPALQDVFFCPICLDRFSHNDLIEKRLTVGHVWPREIRSRSNSTVAVEQRVLLCHRCNSLAGTRGDKQMQLREKIKEGEKTGQLYGERRVQVHLSSGEEPINLSARVSTSVDRLSARLDFPADAKGMQWARNNPIEQQRFRRWADSGEECSMLIQPHHEHRHDLATVGWITSAYLLAFYTFGYRYAFHEALDPVREYILTSFEDIVPERLLLPASIVLDLNECTAHFFEDPEIGLLVPFDGSLNVHLQVSFLDYHVRLPFHFVRFVLQALLFSQPGILSGVKEQRVHNVYMPISCNKLGGHSCRWDYVLGKPIPEDVLNQTCA